MPTFHWRGRDGAGAAVEGDLEAANQGEVVARLRAAGILVIDVEGSDVVVPATAGAPSSPPAPEGMAARLARERDTGRPRRLQALLIVAFLGAVAIGVGAMGPVVSYRCERTGRSAPAECVVRQRPLGLVTLREQRLTAPVAVGDEIQGIPVYSRGVTLEGFRSRLVLRDARGNTLPLTVWDEQEGPKSDLVGQSEVEIRRALADFLADDSMPRVSGWRAHQVTLVFGWVLMLLAVLMLALLVLSTFARPTEAIYAAVNRLAVAADRARAANAPSE